MPYIKQEEREKWKKVLEDIKEIIIKLEKDEVEGELNYFITSLLKQTYEPKYSNYNNAMGLLECIKLEFYRRDIGDYEDKKIEENGDVE